MVIKTTEKEKKHGLINTVTAGLLAGITYISALTGCGLALPENSVPFNGNYPKLTAESKQSLEERFLEIYEHGTVISDLEDFSDLPKELFNHLEDFRNEDRKNAGTPKSDLSAVDVSVVPAENIDVFCGDNNNFDEVNSSAEACYKRLPGKDRIVISGDEIVKFSRNLSHELGHNYRSGQQEYTSVANQLFNIIKAYQFSKPIGSLLLFKPEYFHSPYTNDQPFNQIDPFEQIYIRGNILALQSLLDNHGNIEQTEAKLASMNLEEMKAVAEARIDSYDQNTPFSKVINDLWDEVLADEAIVDKELLGYFKIAREMMKIFENDDNVEVMRNIIDSSRTFLQDNPAGNPYFRANVINHLNGNLLINLERKMNEGTTAEETSAQAEEIIILNQDYPCQETNIYTCPTSVRKIDTDVLDAYFYLLESALDVDELKRNALNYAHNFFNQYFPQTDFINGEFEQLANPHDQQIIAVNYVPAIASMAAQIARSLGDDDTAQKFYQAALTAQCSEVDNNGHTMFNQEGCTELQAEL